MVEGVIAVLLANHVRYRSVEPGTAQPLLPFSPNYSNGGVAFGQESTLGG
jgi:hypothetical protein